MRVAFLTALFPGALRHPVPEPGRRAGGAGPPGGRVRRRPPARRPVPPRCRSPRAAVAHPLPAPLARGPARSVARGGGGNTGPSRGGAPDAAPDPRPGALLAPRLDPRPAPPHRALPAGPPLRHLLLRVRHGRTARAPPPPSRGAGRRAGGGLSGRRHHEVRCSKRARGSTPGPSGRRGCCFRCATFSAGGWSSWGPQRSGSWCIAPASICNAGPAARGARALTEASGW